MSARETPPPRLSVPRSAGVFLAATTISHLSQFVWLAAGSRAMSHDDFGAVLAAQVLYAVLQIAIDNGTAQLGAREAARGAMTDLDLGRLVRLRLALTAVAVPAGLAIGAASAGLAATAPFMAALLLFALVNVWRPYGQGDPRPWAGYMFGRSVLPAAVASAYALSGGSFPVELAGGLECVVLVVLIAATGQRPLRELRLALRSRGMPWRPVLSIGVPAMLQQASVAAGTIGLSAGGAPRAAGALAACVRLLTGLNALNGIVATAMFPSLAERGGLGAGVRRVVLGLRMTTAVAFAATAAVCLVAKPLAQTLLDRTSDAIESALVLTTAGAAGMGTIVMLTYLLVAASGERRVLPAYAAGAGVTLAGVTLVVASGGERVDTIAALLVAGQLTTAAGLVLPVARSLPDYRGPARAALAGAVALAAVAVTAVVTDAAVPAGVVLAAVAVAVGWGGARPLVGVLRTRGAGPRPTAGSR
ncbi:MAG TPA: hypothetical protein VF517_01955 [Thermoleophilaceae bacterium]|jgi:hypothetical protein